MNESKRETLMEQIVNAIEDANVGSGTVRVAFDDGNVYITRFNDGVIVQDDEPKGLMYKLGILFGW